MLGYFPKAREALDVRKIGFERPRPEIVELLGEANQGCPCLVLADPARADGLPVLTFGEKTFMNDQKAILEYLARNYGTSRPSHD